MFRRMMHLHSHNHSDSHRPNRSHAGVDYNFAFGFGIVLNTIYILVEAGYGLAIGSLALLADAGHNLSDVLGLLLAWGGYYLGRIGPTPRWTYGWRSSSILAAFLNALLLLMAVGAITWEAVQRFSNPVPIQGATIMVVAGIGVLINVLTALLFLRGRKHDINIQGAFLHMAADAGVSLGVVLAGLLTMLYQVGWIDPAVSLLIAAVILLSTWGLLRDSTALLLHAVPPGIDVRGIAKFLTEADGVQAMHDLHIWAMSTTETALTTHLVVPEQSDTDQLLDQLRIGLQAQFGIAHTTIQIERSAKLGCPQELDGAI